MARVLITGGAGFLGSHLADVMLAEGHTVICMDNFITGSPDNIAHLFGVAATRQRKRVELIIELQPEGGDRDCERLGIDQQTRQILGLEIPLVCLPVASGRNLSNLVEVAARSLLLRLKGFNPAEELNARLQQSMQEPEFAMGHYDLDEGDLE